MKNILEIGVLTLACLLTVAPSPTVEKRQAVSNLELQPAEFEKRNADEGLLFLFGGTNQEDVVDHREKRQATDSQGPGEYINKMFNNFKDLMKTNLKSLQEAVADASKRLQQFLDRITGGSGGSDREGS